MDTLDKNCKDSDRRYQVDKFSLELQIPLDKFTNCSDHPKDGAFESRVSTNEIEVSNEFEN